MLHQTLASLKQAIKTARKAGQVDEASLMLVDNGNDAGLAELAAKTGWNDAKILSGQGNAGFGRGHNLAMAQGMGDLHLVLNPDVDLEPDSLSQALSFMNAHPECGVLAPAIVEADSNRHFLCKRIPTVFDLFLRGFMPTPIRRFFSARLARYEMQDKAGEAVLWDAPIMSGCFMLCRSKLLRELSGFDPRYFLYFEDFDLSLRAGKQTRLAAVDAVRIRHFGGGAGRKGWRHVRMFCTSACRFFATHGWRFF